MKKCRWVCVWSEKFGGSRDIYAIKCGVAQKHERKKKQCFRRKVQKMMFAFGYGRKGDGKLFTRCEIGGMKATNRKTIYYPGHLYEQCTF